MSQDSAAAEAAAAALEDAANETPIAWDFGPVGGERIRPWLRARAAAYRAGQ